MSHMQMDSAWAFNIAVTSSFISKHLLTFLKASLPTYMVISCGRGLHSEVEVVG